MPETASGSITVTVNGRTYAQDISVTSDNKGGASPNVAAAATGTLTTRTDDDTGTITAASGSHGVTTGSLIDIYWDGGSRRHLLVGTVSGTSIPFGASGTSAGDVLPAASTAVTFMMENEENHVIDGDDVTSIGANSPSYPATIVFREAAGAEGFAIELDAGESYAWTAESGLTNPLAGKSIETITLTHGGSASASDLYVDWTKD